MILPEDHLNELLQSCDLADKRASAKNISLQRNEIIATTDELRSLVHEVLRARETIKKLTHDR